VVHGDFRYSRTFQRRLLQVYSLLCHHMLDHYKGGTKRGQVWNFDQNSDCFKWFWSNILLPFQVNQTFLNIGNITYTQTTSTKIQIGPSSRWVEIGFVGIHATHGSHTMPGKFLGNFQNLRSQQNSLKVLSWCGFLGTFGHSMRTWQSLLDAQDWLRRKNHLRGFLLASSAMFYGTSDRSSKQILNDWIQNKSRWNIIST